MNNISGNIETVFSNLALEMFITLTGLLTGCGKKKRKLCGFWEANCAVKNGDCAGIVQDCAIV